MARKGEWTFLIASEAVWIGVEQGSIYFYKYI